MLHVQAGLRKEPPQFLRHSGLRQGRNAAHRGKTHNAGNEFFPLCGTFRLALAAAVTADRRRRKAARLGQLPSGAFQLHNISVELILEQHRFSPIDWYCITNGIGNSLFGPNQPCTRAQIVTFLWRAADSSEPKGSAAGMTDVAAGSYYEKAVAWAAAKIRYNNLRKLKRA